MSDAEEDGNIVREEEVDEEEGQEEDTANVETPNARDELFDKNLGEKNKTVLTNLFDSNAVIIKNANKDIVDKARGSYDFLENKDGTYVSIYVPKKPNIMKLVCLVRFIWPADGNDTSLNLAKYMLMGYRLDSDDSDYGGKPRKPDPAVANTETSPPADAVEVEADPQPGGGGGQKGGVSSGAKGRTGIFTTEQQENIKKFRKFIGSLDGGFTAQAQRNITSTPIDDIADGLFSQEDVGKNIKKQFKNFLRLDSYMSSDPLIIYKLYKLKDSIGSNTSYSTFLKLEVETKKLYIYKFSVNYKCAIVEDVLYYQKNVE